jgi:predicted metal-binding protein
MKNREGAFSIYKETSLELVGYTTCDGCPGGNIEYAVEEMTKNGVEKIHLATGLIVGYPPCPYLEYFRDFIESNYDIPVVFGTHPIPEKYVQIHQKLGTWNDSLWGDIVAATMSEKKMRIAYN